MKNGPQHLDVVSLESGVHQHLEGKRKHLQGPFVQPWTLLAAFSLWGKPLSSDYLKIKVAPEEVASCPPLCYTWPRLSRLNTLVTTTFARRTGSTCPSDSTTTLPGGSSGKGNGMPATTQTHPRLTCTLGRKMRKNRLQVKKRVEQLVVPSNKKRRILEILWGGETLDAINCKFEA